MSIEIKLIINERKALNFDETFPIGVDNENINVGLITEVFESYYLLVYPVFQNNYRITNGLVFPLSTDDYDMANSSAQLFSTLNEALYWLHNKFIFYWMDALTNQDSQDDPTSISCNFYVGEILGHILNMGDSTVD